MTSPRGPVLPAPDPHSWLREHLLAHQSRHDEAHGVAQTGGGRPEEWVTLREVTADGGALLARLHAGLCDRQRVPRPAAVKWLASWFGGSLAASLAFTRLYADAAIHLTDDGVRYRLGPEGYPERVELRPDRIVVTEEHPWARLMPPDCEVVLAPDADGLDGAVIEEVRHSVTPVLEALGRLARVGRRALWLEVGDDMAMTLTHSRRLPADQAVVASLGELLNHPGAPWTKRPEMRLADGPAGPIVVGRKAGCCLAYTAPGEDPVHEEQSPYLRAYRRRFPPAAGERDTCVTCSLRTLDDCVARQQFWAEHHAQQEEMSG